MAHEAQRAQKPARPPLKPSGRPYSQDTSWSWKRSGAAWKVTRTTKTVWHATSDTAPGRKLGELERLFGQLELPLR